MQAFPKLFKRSTIGRPQSWQIFVDGNQFWTEAGQVDGIISTSAPTTCEGKNAGQSNERTPEAQALAEATSKHQKKMDKGYVDSIEKIDNTPLFFSPMLAKKFVDRKDKINWKKGAIVQPKLDGHRCVITKDGATTRNGIVYESIPHILYALKPLFDADPDLILDGEVYNHDLHDDFNRISSIVRKTKLSLADIFESESLAQFHCYDCPSIGDLNQDDPFTTRYAAMSTLLTSLNSGCIKVVPNMAAYSEAEVITCHDAFVSDGYEGIIVRIADSRYENKRSSYLLKYKVFDDSEFIIEGVTAGRGLKANMAGKIETRTAGGATFSSNIKAPHSVLKNMLANAHMYVGKTCTIRYFGVNPATGIPRFPYVIDIDRWTYE